MLTHISVRGAREHNLKGVDVEIPRESLTVITGLSGSGKSSLAFDTIYAEGQRRYVESLSAYARQFLEMMQKPDVEHIDGLSPAISIEQKTTSRNPRSTVATVTEIYDYMRLLWARVGVPYSPATGLREGIQARLADSFEQALKLADGLAYLDPADSLPLPGREGPGVGSAGAGSMPDAELRSGPTPNPSLDREGNEPGFKLDYAPPGRILFSEKFACPVSGFTIAEIEPRLFSFNAPQGACPACDGLGEKLVFDEDLIVPNHNLSIAKGAVVPWAKSQPPSPYYMQVLSSLARAYDFDLHVPWRDLPDEARDVILRGTGGRPVVLRFIDGKRSYEVKKPFEGVINNLARRMAQTESAWMREELSRYQSSLPCEVCGGARLKPEALSVKIAGEDISMSTRRSVADAYAWFAELHTKLTPTQNEIARAILKELNERLGFLHSVGLDYLHLDRTSGTLSGGESQRIPLASQIGSGLPRVLYLLDD